MKIFHVLLLFCCFATAQENLSAQPANHTQKVESLLSQMTLEEKIGQMTLYTTDWGSTGPTIREGYTTDIRSGACGALFNSHTTVFTRELQRIAVEESRMKIPLLFGYDVIHGYKTIFPIPLGEAASWDPAAAEMSARVAAVEASASGLHWTFAPMCDVGRDPRWGRVMEGAGEDPYLGSRFAEARVRGFQGNGLGNIDAMVACVKHFAAYGAPIAGRDYNTVDMSERYFRDFYLPPYEAAIRAGAATVMTSFNDYDGMPASGNKHLLTDILRKELGFKGFIVTDYTSINEMVNHGVAADDKAAGELAANAGVDMDMQGAVYQRFLAQSVREGKVSMSQIDDAVRRVLTLKIELGLFDDPYKFCDAEREKRVMLSADHRAKSREVARKSVVLLKNEGQTLPLNPKTKIALIGPLGDNQSELIGAWPGSGSGSDCISLMQGLKNAGGNVTFNKGCNVEGDDRSGFDAAVALARQSDVIVLAVGEMAWMSGEASSRTDLNLPGVQEELARALKATGKPLVVIMMNGRPLTIPWFAENASSILEAWWLGTETGNALADILYGAYNPSGKLPMTFPRNVGQVPIFYNEKSTGRPYDPNSKWTSKYIDSPNTPLYAFGFGLSYTTFSYGDPTVNMKTFKSGEKITLSVRLTNSGKFEGEETVQLYIRDLVASSTRPVKELKGFQKIRLKPGESRDVRFEIVENDLKFYRHDMTYGAEPGDFDLMVGGSSDAVKTIRIELKAK